MLKFLRNKKVMKKIFWALAILIIPAFTLWGVGTAIKEKSRGPSYAGEIFNKKVSLKDYESAYRATMVQAKLSYGEKFNEISKFLNLGKQTWDRILILYDTSRNNITVSDKELSAKIASFPFFQKDGRFNLEIYGRLIKYFFQCEPKFFEEVIRDSMKITKRLDKITGSLKITDEELKKLYQDEYEKAKISFILYDAQTLRQDAAVSDTDIEKYYEANKNDYKIPEKVSISYLEFKYKDFEKDISVTDPEIKGYYDSNIKEFEKPEEVRARHILVKTDPEAKEILEKLKKDPSLFEALAKDRSLDPGSKQTGGDLGYFPRGRMIKEFEDAAFNLKPGEISDIIKSNFGYHIIKLEDRKKSYTEEFDKVKDNIKNKLLKERSRELAIKLAGEIADKVLNDPKNFENIARTYKLEIKNSEPFQKDGSIPLIGFVPEINKKAFSMKPGEVSELITGDSPGAEASFIIKLKEILPARQESLNEAKDRIRDILVSKKSHELALKKSQDDYETIELMSGEGMSLDEICEILDLKLEKSGEFPRKGFINGLGQADEIAESVFSLKPGEASNPLTIKRGALIARLDEIIGIDEKKFKDEAEEFGKSKLEQKENNAFEDYLKGLYERSKIKMYVTSLEDIYK